MLLLLVQCAFNAGAYDRRGCLMTVLLLPPLVMMVGVVVVVVACDGKGGYGVVMVKIGQPR